RGRGTARRRRRGRAVVGRRAPGGVPRRGPAQRHGGARARRAAVARARDSGELSVGQEHLATAVVRTSLQRLLSDTRPGVRGTAVLACAPGEQHDVGLLMLSVLLRGDGWEIAYLGADTPVDEATALAARLGAGALCFSTSREETARELARGLAGKQLAATVVVGGRVTDAPPELERTVQTLREAT